MKNDKVNHPSHYTQGTIECIDAIAEATKHLTGIDAVCTANVIKYIWRWKLKNGIEDLRKAEWYLKKLLSNNDSGATGIKAGRKRKKISAAGSDPRQDQAGEQQNNNGLTGTISIPVQELNPTYVTQVSGDKLPY